MFEVGDLILVDKTLRRRKSGGRYRDQPGKKCGYDPKSTIGDLEDNVGLVMKVTRTKFQVTFAKETRWDGRFFVARDCQYFLKVG